MISLNLITLKQNKRQTRVTPFIEKADDGVLSDVV